MKDAIKAVEDAFKAYGEGKTKMPPVVTFKVEKFHGEMDVKSGYIETIDAAGVKVAGGFWDNPRKYNLPSVIGTFILSSAETGAPLAVMDATYLTAVRTGAAGAVGAKYLARKDSEIIGIIGAGAQGRMQLLGLNELFKIKKVRGYDKFKDAREKYAAEMSEKLGLNVIAVDSAEEAVRDADIIVAATPSTTPIVMDDSIEQGMHINAIGADAPGKNELDPKIFKRTKIVVDRIEQAIRIGDIQTAFSLGIITKADIYAEIGELVTGRKKGRETDDEITVFDSSGLAIQDIATAYTVYKRAQQKKMGTLMDFFRS